MIWNEGTNVTGPYMYKLNMKFKKEKKWISIAYSIHPRPVPLTSPHSLFCMHEPTHNYHVVVFIGPNPGFCQPDWGSIVGLHDPIRLAYIDLLGRWSSTRAGSVGVVVGSCQQKDEDFRFSLGCGGGGV